MMTTYGDIRGRVCAHIVAEGISACREYDQMHEGRESMAEPKVKITVEGNDSGYIVDFNDGSEPRVADSIHSAFVVIANDIHNVLLELQTKAARERREARGGDRDEFIHDKSAVTVGEPSIDGAEVDLAQEGEANSEPPTEQ